jgi:hypothetical protein
LVRGREGVFVAVQPLTGSARHVAAVAVRPDHAAVGVGAGPLRCSGGSGDAVQRIEGFRAGQVLVVLGRQSAVGVGPGVTDVVGDGRDAEVRLSGTGGVTGVTAVVAQGWSDVAEDGTHVAAVEVPGAVEPQLAFFSLGGLELIVARNGELIAGSEVCVRDLGTGLGAGLPGSQRDQVELNVAVVPPASGRVLAALVDAAVAGILRLAPATLPGALAFECGSMVAPAWLKCPVAA